MRVIFMATHASNVDKKQKTLIQEGNTMADDKTFTQEELDSIVEGRLARGKTEICRL